MKWLFELFVKEVERQYDFENLLGNLAHGLSNKDVISLLARLHYNRVIKYHDDNLIFTFCLSKEGDLLSQWRAYANNGMGVAIGFNKKFLELLANEIDYLSLNEIKYMGKEDAAPDLLQDYVQDYIGAVDLQINSGDIKSLIKDYKDLSDLNISQRIFEQCNEDFPRDSITYKNIAFHEEREWRLIYDIRKPKWDNDWCSWRKGAYDKPAEKNIPNGIQFRTNGNNIIPYVDLCFEAYMEDGIDIINEIIVGPQSNISESDIYHLLSIFGYLDPNEPQYKPSTATYR